ncbi:putative ABC transporter permease [Zhenhengia yiwuensis]|uniref:ABC transporter permease n=1 Tax=Zhenhengia yiwuensis TaxID=2763666 RepID=A0A926EG75_9FIRM|nr:putative ABC transporter permease [Zhenhengia yiwuensis]MBC8578365.1 putative ABC transporter permease [Zhenhengia yiwuensis]
MSPFYIFILYFAIYSILGWSCEVIYCSLPAKHFINHGFLNGPYCPVYGIGALIVLYLLEPYKASPFLVLLLGIFLTSLLEYITSYMLEKAFHAHWWDYSKRKCNIHGRVCLLNSTLFGILSLLIIYLVHPAVMKFILHIPENALPLIVMGFECLFCIDLVVTLYTVSSLKARIYSISEISQLLKTKHDITLKPKVLRTELTLYLEQELSKKLSKKNILHQRLLNAFPHMQFIHLEEYMDKLRKRLK